jgi:hypothetical protein
MVDFDEVTVKATHTTMVRERWKSMDSSQIEQYLGFLGQKLADMQVTTSLILLGGALMITQIGNRKATQDIDVVIATNDRHTYQAVQQAIALIAKEKKLPPAWLNDDVTIVVDQIGKPKAPKLWKIFGNLTVYVPELEYILALKLFSGRPQDDRDIQAIAQRLSLQTRAQAWSIVNTYIPNAQLGFRSAYTSQAIDRCFPN